MYFYSTNEEELLEYVCARCSSKGWWCVREKLFFTFSLIFYAIVDRFVPHMIMTSYSSSQTLVFLDSATGIVPR